MNLRTLARDIARNLGTEFPAPPPEMILRQLASMAEEIFELQEAIAGESLPELRAELADVAITPYLVAHYAGIDLTAHELGRLGQPIKPLYVHAARALKAGRRYLGIARTGGNLWDFATALADLVRAVRAIADSLGVDLDTAIEDKVREIFARGWRKCGACGEGISGLGWFHHRLGVYLHDDPACQANVAGEDVRGHCMSRVGVAADVSHSGL